MTQLSVHQGRGQFGNNPYGNMTALKYTLQVDTKGLIVGTNHNEIVKADDIIHLGEIPQGFVLFEIRAVVESAFNAGEFEVGFSYTDGKDDERYPQKDTGIFSLPTLTTKDEHTNGDLLPKAFPKDAYLDLKVTTPPTKGEKAGVLTIYLIGTLNGHA